LGLALPAAALADTTWPGALVMGTGRPGGDYMLYGPGWGRLIRQETGVGIAYRASGGAEANILLIDEDEAQLGLTSMVVAIQASMGNAAWTAGVQFRSFRALFTTYPSILQIVSPRGTGITALAALAGQDIGVGPAGSSGAATVQEILRSVGVTPHNAATGDFEDQVSAMLAGRLAACAFIGAPPVPAIAQAAMGRTLSLIGFSGAEALQVARALPGMLPIVLEAGVFPGQKTPVASVGTANIAICSASLPDALANAVTKAALRDRTVLAALVPAASIPPDISAVTEAGIYFHPGAAAALRDAGVKVPKAFIQP